VKNRFQNLPFKFNLQRYNVVLIPLTRALDEVGLCTLESR
jgi:hypothetical protein